MYIAARSQLGGTQKKTLVESDGHTYMVKSTAHPTTVRGVERRLFNTVAKVLSQKSFRTGYSCAQTEAETLRRWRAHGIPTPNAWAVRNDLLLIEYLDNHPDYKDVLAGEPTRTEVDALINTHQKIRRLALKEGDPSLLHPDPHPGNFLYSRGEKIVYAIDPGCLLRKDLEIKQLDARTTLFFLRHLERAHPLNGTEYAKRFIARCETPMLQEIADCCTTDRAIYAAVRVYDSLTGTKRAQQMDPRGIERIRTAIGEEIGVRPTLRYARGTLSGLTNQPA